jgi:diguanylate cyclase (GGDEF)-like protein
MFIEPFLNGIAGHDSVIGANAQCNPCNAEDETCSDARAASLAGREQAHARERSQMLAERSDSTCALLAKASLCEVAMPVRPKLLVVDDEPINLHAMYGIFAEDHQLMMANNGERALALCASLQPDLVLLDMVMPGMDGEEVCRRLKADDATRHIPVIFVTARSGEEAEARGLDLGAVDFITKPVNPHVVRARVRTQLTLKRQSDMLRQWCYVDALTEVRNRRCFDESLAREYARATRGNWPLSAILIDLDFFKGYNDRYGHPAGDACLRRVAGALKSVLQRPGDLIARYGGEEFACLLPDTTPDGAMMVAERLRHQVQELQIEHAGSKAADVMTISVGVCSTQPTEETDFTELLSATDEQLYAAKARGRNQVSGVWL